MEKRILFIFIVNIMGFLTFGLKAQPTSSYHSVFSTAMLTVLVNNSSDGITTTLSDSTELWNGVLHPFEKEKYINLIRNPELDILLTDFPIEVNQMVKDDYLKDSIPNIFDELHLKKFRWMEQLNLDSLSMLLDENVAYIHSNGWKETKEEVIHNLASGKLKYISVNIHESDVRIWNSTAVVTGKGLFIVSLDGKPIEINLFYTEVYTITEEGIFLVSRHACRY